ncbi:MAG: hypothetical protein OXT72_09335 [Gammaproteobacteria bacterium]|nr:hypothetical protein [Gammaproteobacteria bacterium]MDE0247267.1 hypothetical protein [Gammaproteobacteria bacterium]
MPRRVDVIFGLRRPAVTGGPGLTAGVAALVLCGAVPLSGQPTSGADPRLTGELVRFTDGVVDVSVLATGVGAVPPSLWRRAADGVSVGFHAGGSPAANTAAREQVADAVGSGLLEEVDGPGGAASVRIAVTADDQLRLNWHGLTEEEAVGILAVAREADGAFSLTIRIPDPTYTTDWWGLQAALSQAGIRRVRIVSGDPGSNTAGAP